MDSLLQELLDTPTGQASSHLDILLDLIADSPAHAPSLGKLSGCSHALKQQTHRRLQNHKEEVADELRHQTATRLMPTAQLRLGPATNVRVLTMRSPAMMAVSRSSLKAMDPPAARTSSCAIREAPLVSRALRKSSTMSQRCQRYRRDAARQYESCGKFGATVRTPFLQAFTA